MTAIYHIAEGKAWREAEAAGVYRPESLGSEGFIHCSTREQLRAVAELFYAGRQDLVVLEMDPEALGDRLVWEAPAHPAPAGSQLASETSFPHVYGPIELAAVVSVQRLEL